MFMGFIEIVKYNVQIYGSNPDNFLTRVNYLTLGALYFTICLFIYYLLNGIEHVNSKYVKEQLEGLAYTDELTGLMNRAKCMQFTKTLSGPYAVVSIDLDRLKTVNDSHGHLEGDRMIKSFAELLVKAFQGASLIGRTGGDEFMVIYENPSSNVCDMAIRQLEDDMNEFNQKGEIFNLSASMGYAYSSERSSMGFTDVFYLADSRMYEMKEKHHA
jgi:diguanylate cyclase (GGDEF)-like protein